MNRILCNLIFIIIIFVAIFVLWWNCKQILVCCFPNETIEKFIDMFGSINALFSGFAFAGIIITLVFQMGELKETRKQINKQNFEGTFSNLISIHAANMNSLIYMYGSNETNKYQSKGRYCFVQIYNDYINKIFEKPANGKLTRKPIKEGINKNSTDAQLFYNAYSEYLFPHFADLFNIIQYLETQRKEFKKDKTIEFKFYFDLTIDQMSNHELYLLYFYGARNNENSNQIEEIRRKIKEHDMIRNIPKGWPQNELDFDESFVDISKLKKNNDSTLLP